VFLTPEGKPFYGGTYFPPSPRYGMPGFRQVLTAVADAWQKRREELQAAGDRLTQVLSQSRTLQPNGTALATDLPSMAAANLLRTLDRNEGGFSDAPKFPQPMTLDFLLQTYTQTGDQALLDAVRLTLTKMTRGGIYDHLGGGFHRYSTDAHWLVPHFEKMLYDNAQLARTYLHAWQVTGDPDYRRVVEETLDYVLREMTAPEGGFYSTQDADSEGEEGKYFLWTPAEVRELLGEEDARLFMSYYQISPGGNFHEAPGKSILHAPQDLATVARALRVAPESLSQALERGRAILFAARMRRLAPGCDDKILAEWNGLMLQALAEAGAALARPDYLRAARRAADFLLERMATRAQDGSLRLYRSCKDRQVRFNAYLEDYASVGLGLLALYEATLDLRWLQTSAAFPEILTRLFADPDGAGFYQTGTEHDALIARRKDLMDNAVPAGNSMAAELLLRLGQLLTRSDYTEQAAGLLESLAEMMVAHPGAFGRLLCAAGYYLRPGYEIAVIGDPLAPPARALLAQVWDRYLPTSVLAACVPGDTAATALIPLLANRSQINGQATAYVCQNYTCNLPVIEPEALAHQLENNDRQK
jgi:uncharacterized protein